MVPKLTFQNNKREWNGRKIFTLCIWELLPLIALASRSYDYRQNDSPSPLIYRLYSTFIFLFFVHLMGIPYTINGALLLAERQKLISTYNITILVKAYSGSKLKAWVLSHCWWNVYIYNFYDKKGFLKFIIIKLLFNKNFKK